MNFVNKSVCCKNNYIQFLLIYLFTTKYNNEIKQNSNTKANKSGEEDQKKPWGL